MIADSELLAPFSTEMLANNSHHCILKVLETRLKVVPHETRAALKKYLIWTN